jgi:signal transduction histidine kinase
VAEDTGGSPLSLRSRVMLGAVLWSAGLFTIGGIMATLATLLRSHASLMLHVMLGRHKAASFVLALLFMLAGVWQVRKGLSTLTNLRARLANVRDGRQRHVDGRYPAEVAPLVADLNALLDHREQAVRRAVGKAGDLAHGLKTPLAVLAHEAARADAGGQHELAASIEQQVDRMRRQVDYHLAQARAAASGATPGARCAAAPAAAALARTLLRLHADRGVAIQVNVGDEHAFRGQREDLDEMLGNLLDNACKWARTRVEIESSVAGSTLLITVDDDGPGLDPGSGLGLAIVRDLAALYGGSIALEASPLGGLRARLELPG